MTFYYKNSAGTIIDFSEYPYLMQEGTLLDYAYNYEFTEGTTQKLTNVKHVAGEREFQICILPSIEEGYSNDKRRELMYEYANALLECFDYDVRNGVDGRLYTDSGWYLPCRILASSKDVQGLFSGETFNFQTFTVVSTKNQWYTDYVIESESTVWVETITINTLGGTNLTVDPTDEDEIEETEGEDD